MKQVFVGVVFFSCKGFFSVAGVFCGCRLICAGVAGFLMGMVEYL